MKRKQPHLHKDFRGGSTKEEVPVGNFKILKFFGWEWSTADWNGMIPLAHFSTSWLLVMTSNHPAESVAFLL